MLPIRTVLIYTGHKAAEVLGPYSENVSKRVQMFTELNPYRERLGRAPWVVKKSSGEELNQAISRENPSETLLVLPAGQSSHLDRVFSAAQLAFLKEDFFQKGGRAYVNCGSAYWSSRKRIYLDVCSQTPNAKRRIEKTSPLPLFDGTAIGPLCPYPGAQYKVGFFSDAVTVTDGTEDCTIFLSGGGGFVLPPKSFQQQRVLLRYKPSELRRLNRSSYWENAALLTSFEQGAALLTMFHPYYSPRDIDSECYERTFPHSGTNWREVHSRLTPTPERMKFVLEKLLFPLEDSAFTW